MNRCNERSDLKTIPKTTHNQLKDIVGWLKLGDILILHINWNYARYFHKGCWVKTDEAQFISEKQCQRDPISRSTVLESAKQYANNARFIYVNIERMPDLLKEGEWTEVIQQAGYPECRCAVHKLAQNPKNVPYAYSFKI